MEVGQFHREKWAPALVESKLKPKKVLLLESALVVNISLVKRHNLSTLHFRSGDHHCQIPSVSSRRRHHSKHRHLHCPLV
jgi:hypothetical protein